MGSEQRTASRPFPARCSLSAARSYNPPPLPDRALLDDVLASLRDPALRYADVRVTVTSEQHVRVRNGEVDTLAATIDRAAGVRVLVGNGWGFAAVSDVSEGSIRAAAGNAAEFVSPPSCTSRLVLSVLVLC